MVMISQNKIYAENDQETLDERRSQLEKAQN